MRCSSMYPCLLIRKEDGRITGVIIMKVDDRLGVGTDRSLAEEEKAATQIEA